jgi:hypothetical protein
MTYFRVSSKKVVPNLDLELFPIIFLDLNLKDARILSYTFKVINMHFGLQQSSVDTAVPFNDLKRSFHN